MGGIARGMKAAWNAIKPGVKIVIQKIKDGGIGAGGASKRAIQGSGIDLKKTPTKTPTQIIQDNKNPFRPADKGGSSKGVPNIPLEPADIKGRPQIQDKPKNVTKPNFPPKKEPGKPIIPPLAPKIPGKPRTEPVDNKKVPFPPKPPNPSPSPGDKVDPRKRPPGERRRPPNEHTEPCEDSSGGSGGSGSSGKGSAEDWNRHDWGDDQNDCYMAAIVLANHNLGEVFVGSKTPNYDPISIDPDGKTVIRGGASRPSSQPPSSKFWGAEPKSVVTRFGTTYRYLDMWAFKDSPINAWVYHDGVNGYQQAIVEQFGYDQWVISGYPPAPQPISFRGGTSRPNFSSAGYALWDMRVWKIPGCNYENEPEQVFPNGGNSGNNGSGNGGGNASSPSPCPPPGVDPPAPPPKLEECPEMSGCDCQTVYQIVQSLLAKYSAETQNHVTESTEIGMEFVNESHDFTRELITQSKDEILLKIDGIQFPEFPEFPEIPDGKAEQEELKKWIVKILPDFGKRTLQYVTQLFNQQTYFLEDRIINYYYDTQADLNEIREMLSYTISTLVDLRETTTNYFEEVLDDLASIRQLIIECCKKVKDIDFAPLIELIDVTADKIQQTILNGVALAGGAVISSLANTIVVSGNNTVNILGEEIETLGKELIELESDNFDERTKINRQNLKLVYDLLLEIYKCCKDGGGGGIGTAGINLNKDCCDDIKGTLDFSLCDSEEKVDPANEIAEDVADKVVGSLSNLVSSLIPGNIDDAVVATLQGTIKKIVKGFVAAKIKPYVNSSKNARSIPYEGNAFKGIESQIKALSQQLDLAVKEICSKNIECPDEEQYIFSGSLEFATCDENAKEISILDSLVVTTSNFVVSRIVSELVSKLFPFLKAEFDDKTLDATIGNLEDMIKNELKSLFYRFLPIPKNERIKPYHGYNFEGVEKMILALSDQINYITEQLCGKMAATVPVTPSAPIITKVILPESAIDGLSNFQCEDYDGALAFPYQGSGIQGISSQLVALENGMNVILRQICSVKKDVSSTESLNGNYSFKCGNDTRNFTYSGKGIIGLSSQLAALAQGINAVLSEVCDSEEEVKKEIDNSRRQIIENENNNSQETNNKIDNTRNEVINNQNTNSQATNNNINNTRNEYEQELEQNFKTIGDAISNINNTVNNINNTVNNPDNPDPDNPDNPDPNNPDPNNPDPEEYINGQIQLFCNGIPSTFSYSGTGLDGISKGIEAMGSALQTVLDQVCKPDDFISGQLSIECDNYPYSFTYSGTGFEAITSSVEALNNVMQIVLNQVCKIDVPPTEFIDDSIQLTCDSQTTTYNYYGEGLTGITKGINALSQAIQLVLDRVCLPDPLADTLTVTCDNETHDFSYQGDGTSAIASGLQSVTSILQIILDQVCDIPSTTETTEIWEETRQEINDYFNQEISNVEEVIGDILEISQEITNTVNSTSTAQKVTETQLGNLSLVLNNYLEDYEKNSAKYTTALTQIDNTLNLVSQSVNVELSNSHSVDCDVQIDKQVKPKPCYVTNGVGLYEVDPIENNIKEIKRSYLNPTNIGFSGFLPNTLLSGIAPSNIVASTLLAGFPGYSAIYSAIGLAANQLLELIIPAASAIQFDGLTFNHEEKIYLARSTPDRQTQYFKVKPDTGDIELIAESPNDLTEGVGALTKTFAGQTDIEDPKVEYTYSLGVSNTRQDFKLLRLNEQDFSSLETVLPQEINALLKSDPYTSGLPGSRQDYVLSITFDRDNNLYISSAQYDEDALGGYIKKRRLTRITNSGVGNISIIKDYPAIRSTGAQVNEIDQGVIFDVISFDALNQLWGLDLSGENSPKLYRVENCTGEILSQTSPIGETGSEHILIKGNYYNFQFAPNNPEKKLHCLCDGDFKPELEITYQQSQPQTYSYSGLGLKALAQQVDQIFPILQEVVDKVCHPVKDEEYERECLIAQCGNGYLEENVHEIIRYEGSGQKLLSSKLDAVIKLNQFLLNTICQPKDTQGCVALLPDERFAEFTVTRQLILTFGEQYPKQNGSLWHVHVPMPLDEFDWCDHFEISMSKGNVNGRLYWENSKIYTGSYFESEEEARRVLALLAALSTATPRQKNGLLEPRITKGAKTKRNPQNRIIRCVRAVVSDIDPISGDPVNVKCYTPPRGGC
jgi:hypothetical protein